MQKKIAQEMEKAKEFTRAKNKRGEVWEFWCRFFNGQLTGRARARGCGFE